MEKLSGSPGSKSFKIGTITLTEEKTFHNANYQTASWWSDCKCEPQTVDLMTNGYYVFFGFEGVRTAEYFARISAPEGESIGTSDKHSFMQYVYSFCDGVLEGKLDYDVEFDEGYSIVENFTGQGGKAHYCLGKI